MRTDAANKVAAAAAKLAAATKAASHKSVVTPHVATCAAYKAA